MRTRTRRWVVAAAAATPVALVACGTPAAGTAKPGAAREGVAVTFSTPGNARLSDAWQPVLDLNKGAVQLQFQALDADPGATDARGGTYRDRLRSQLAAGTPPDVVALDVFQMLAFKEQGALADLSGFAKARKPAELRLDDFWPEQLDACKIKGALYALPWQGDALLLFFNDALFQAKKLQSPRDLVQAGTWTWQTFVEAAQRVGGDAPAGVAAIIEQQRRNREAKGRAPAAAGGQAGAGSGAAAAGNNPRIYGANRGAWETWVWSNGGEILDGSLARCLLDSPAAIEAFSFMGGLGAKYQVVPNPREVRGLAEVVLFDNGQMGMFFDTRDAVPRLARMRDGTWDAVPVPKGKKGSISRLNLSVFGVTAASKNPEAAFEGVRFLTSTEAQRQWAKRGDAVPSRKSAASSAEFLQFSGPTQATEKANASFVEAVQQGNARLLPLLARWPEINQQVNKDLRPLFSDSATSATVDAGDLARKIKAGVEALLAGGDATV